MFGFGTFQFVLDPMGNSASDDWEVPVKKEECSSCPYLHTSSWKTWVCVCECHEPDG